jgi:uncharacterized membrane protein YraQ (UPF0718 family)
MALVTMLADVSNVLGWVFTLVLVAAIVLAFAYVTLLTVRDVDRYLEAHRYRSAPTAVLLALLTVACFCGLWLPLGVLRVFRRLGRPSN